MTFTLDPEDEAGPGTIVRDLDQDPPPRATLGCVQLPTDLTLDEEGPALVARIPRVRLRLQKLELDGDSIDVANYESGRGRIGRAAAALKPVGSLDVVGLACTSLAFALGIDDVQRELAEAQPGARVTDMASAVIAALDEFAVERVALLTPYVDELHERILALLYAHGRTVVSDENLGLRTDVEMSAVSQGTLHDLACRVDRDDADVVLVACSAFRACVPGFLDQLEEELGKPVISSQQAFLWHMLRTAGIADRIGGYGSLFAERGPDPAARVHVVPATSDATQDFYPSRVDDPGIVDRVDPVVAPTARDAGPLTDAQVDSFERRGAVVLRQVFTPDEVDHLRATTEALAEHYESLGYDELDRSTDMRVITERGGMLVEGDDDKPVLKTIWQIHLPAEHAPHMLFAADTTRRTVCDARLVEVAEQLIGEPVYVHQSRINYQRGSGRHSRGGSGFLWHQDFEQWHCEDGMPRMRALSMAVLLEPSAPPNGALMVMPGSHLWMVQAYRDDDDERYAKGALSSGPVLPPDVVAEMADRYGISYCRGRPGDVVLFDCNTVHGSHTNISPWGRSMFFAVYNAVSNTPAPKPFAGSERRPEHIGSHDPRFAGVPLPALRQSLTAT